FLVWAARLLFCVSLIFGNISTRFCYSAAFFLSLVVARFWAAALFLCSFSASETRRLAFFASGSKSESDSVLSSSVTGFLWRIGRATLFLGVTLTRFFFGAAAGSWRAGERGSAEGGTAS